MEGFDSTTLQITDAEFDTCRALMSSEFPVTTDQTPWELLSKITDVGECTLYRRPLGTTGLYQYYVKGFFNGITAEVAYYVLSLDNKYRRDWDAYALEVDSIDNVDGSDCVYWACKFPWPMSNRDYLFWRKGKFDQDMYLTVSKAGKHDKKPETKSFVRVDTYQAMMCMRQTDKGTEFRLMQYDDMKGSIPKAIVNWAISSGLPEYLKKIHQACTKYPKDKMEETKKRLFGETSTN